MGSVLDTINTPTQTNFRQIFLYRPTEALRNSMRKTSLCDSILTIEEFPISEILGSKMRNKKILVLIEQQYLPQIHYWATIFHHHVMIVKKETVGYGSEDKIGGPKHTYAYLNCSNYCPSMSIKEIAVFQEKENADLENILAQSQPCLENSAPGALILANTPNSMTKKILNMLSFYQLSILKYPSLEYFTAAGCCSTRIICGIKELQQIQQLVLSDKFPAPCYMVQSLQGTKEDSKKGLSRLEIAIYCYCCESDSVVFPTNKLNLLQEKNVSVKFESNMLKLAKEFVKDKNEQIVHQFEEKWSQIIKQDLEEDSLHKPDLKESEQKTLIKTKSPRSSLRNVRLRTVSRVSLSVMTKEESRESFIFFYFHEKESTRYFERSMAKKLNRSLNKFRVKKICNAQTLLEKIKKLQFSIVIISGSPKIYIQFCQLLEERAIEDKVILIKRKQSDSVEELSQKITQTIDRGLLKDEKNFNLNFLNKQLIIIGSKTYLAHIVENYPFLRIKKFVDLTVSQEFETMKDLLSRKNEIIVTNISFCECNSELKGLIRAEIVVYDPKIQPSQLSIARLYQCECAKTQKGTSIIPLTEILNSTVPYFVNFNYNRKKVSAFSEQIKSFFDKIKDKRTLENKCFKSSYNMVFMSSDSWVIDQISCVIDKMMSNRYLNNWLCPSLTSRIVSQCCREITEAVTLEVQTSLSSYHCQKKSFKVFEEATQIYESLFNSQLKQNSILDFSKAVLELFVANQTFRKALNYLWRNLIGFNENEYPYDFSTLLLCILLNFRKSSYLCSQNAKKDQYESETSARPQSNRLYLKVLDFKKSQQEKLCNFFSPKKGLPGFIYTTQFLLCQRVEKVNIQSLDFQASGIFKNKNKGGSLVASKNKSAQSQKVSVEDEIIIVVDEINSLDFSMICPFARAQSAMSLYVLAPLTKLQFNKCMSGEPLTYHLRIPLSLQQKFLQKILHSFIVEKSRRKNDQCKEKSQYQTKNDRKTTVSVKSQNSLRLIQEDFEIPQQDNFFILMSECKYYSAHEVLKKVFLSGETTELYEAVTFSRKGLYFEAQRAMSDTNPYKPTIKLYLELLKNRQYDEHERGSEKPKTMKWSLNFRSVDQKFVLNSKIETEKSYCYNDDSFGATYQEALKITRGNKPLRSYEASSIDSSGLSENKPLNMTQYFELRQNKQCRTKKQHLTIDAYGPPIQKDSQQAHFFKAQQKQNIIKKSHSSFLTSECAENIERLKKFQTQQNKFEVDSDYSLKNEDPKYILKEDLAVDSPKQVRRASNVKKPSKFYLQKKFSESKKGSLEQTRVFSSPERKSGQKKSITDNPVTEKQWLLRHEQNSPTITVTQTNSKGKVHHQVNLFRVFEENNPKMAGRWAAEERSHQQSDQSIDFLDQQVQQYCLREENSQQINFIKQEPSQQLNDSGQRHEKMRCKYSLDLSSDSEETSITSDNSQENTSDALQENICQQKQETNWESFLPQQINPILKFEFCPKENQKVFKRKNEWNPKSPINFQTQSQKASDSIDSSRSSDQSQNERFISLEEQKYLNTKKTAQKTRARYEETIMSSFHCQLISNSNLCSRRELSQKEEPGNSFLIKHINTDFQIQDQGGSNCSSNTQLIDLKSQTQHLNLPNRKSPPESALDALNGENFLIEDCSSSESIRKKDPVSKSLSQSENSIKCCFSKVHPDPLESAALTKQIGHDFRPIFNNLTNFSKFQTEANNNSRDLKQDHLFYTREIVEEKTKKMAIQQKIFHNALGFDKLKLKKRNRSNDS